MYKSLLLYLHRLGAVALGHQLLEAGGGVRPRLVPQEPREAHFESGAGKNGGRQPKGREMG